jgi:hypothetical protein
MVEIVIVNQSSVLTDNQITAVIPAVQAQVNEDFLPIWGSIIKETSVTLDFLPRRKPVPKTVWPLFIMDHTDQPGALGYHEDLKGRIEGKVFAADDQKYGVSWTVDLTHELLEMLGDPDTNDIIKLPDGRQCIHEMCDAVEDDSIAYQKKGVLVSNFVLPPYFFEGQGTKYDFGGKLTGPAPTLTPGGYLGIFDPKTGQWSQVTARLADGTLSRRSQRHGRTEWHASAEWRKHYRPQV